MKTPYISFLKNLLIFSFIIVILYIICSFILPESYFSIALPYLFPFYIATTLLSYHFMLKSLHRRFSKFVNRFMAATAIKLLWYVIIMVSYILIFRSDAVPFAISFFILYLCYTIFETISLVRYSKSYVNQNPSNQS
ncbi:MAG: hypothetical protein D4R67_06595 [Bacteroidetes bacterium]|nr:MAG: hypothetical protein D4R67_06595 [Bacteroidota bacterium]